MEFEWPGPTAVAGVAVGFVDDAPAAMPHAVGNYLSNSLEAKTRKVSGAHRRPGWRAVASLRLTERNFELEKRQRKVVVSSLTNTCVFLEGMTTRVPVVTVL